MGHFSENQALRYRRLAFYSEDVDRFNELLLNFIKKTDAHCALLIDKDGHLVARQGIFADIDSASLSALVAGSFASTREVAKQLGEPEFQVLFHQGTQHSIHITLVGDRTLQVAVFSLQTKPGIIQVMARELAAKVQVILEEIAGRPQEQAEAPKLDSEFSDEMKNQIDDLFGGL